MVPETSFCQTLTKDEQGERTTQYVFQVWFPFIHVNIVVIFLLLFWITLAFLDAYSSWHPAYNSLQDCFVPAPHPVLHIFLFLF